MLLDPRKFDKYRFYYIYPVSNLDTTYLSNACGMYRKSKNGREGGEMSTEGAVYFSIRVEEGGGVHKATEGDGK